MKRVNSLFVEGKQMADLGQIPEIPVEIPEAGPGKGRKILMTMLVVIIGIAIGGAAMYFGGEKLGMINHPSKEGVDRTLVVGADQAQQRIADLERRLDAYSVLGAAPDVKARLEELRDRQESQGAIGQVEAKLRDALEREAEYDALTRDVESLNANIAGAQEQLDSTQRQGAEAQQRVSGLRQEIAGLEQQVGKLEVADARRQAVKNAVLRDVEQLIIQIRKGIPLVPPEYRKDARLARATKLRDELEQENWVRPELLEEYTQLYLEELTMAEQENYFLAKIPLTEKKQSVMKWAECVSLGNRMVYFETLDKGFTGVCRNANPGGAVPRYELLVDLPRAELMRIRDVMEQFRPADYEERIKVQLGQDVEIVGKRGTLAEASSTTS
jgi:hypothetical protein